MHTQWHFLTNARSAKLTLRRAGGDRCASDMGRLNDGIILALQDFQFFLIFTFNFFYHYSTSFQFSVSSVFIVVRLFLFLLFLPFLFFSFFLVFLYLFSFFFYSFCSVLVSFHFFIFFFLFSTNTFCHINIFKYTMNVFLNKHWKTLVYNEYFYFYMWWTFSKYRTNIF